MRIGIHFTNFDPHSGGGYTYVADLMGSFAKRVAESEHHYVILCAANAAKAIRLAVEAQNATVVPVASRSRLARRIGTLRYLSPLIRRVWLRYSALERAARRHDVQLIWFVGDNVYECPDLPYVATIFDLQHRLQPYFPEVSSRGGWDVRESFYGYFLRRASYCLTGTETGKRDAQCLYQLAESRLRVLPLPTPTFALNASPSTIDVRNRFGIAKDYIFYPAQFWPHKNHANLIMALRWLKECRNLELTLVLTGSDKGNLPFVKHFAERQGMAGQVRFLGFVSEEELIALYRNALALTFVTYFGPDNIPPLEAFALGCPVIASAVDGAIEQYGDAATLVDPSDPESIGQAIWRLHSDEKLRTQLVESGIKRAMKWRAADYIGEMFKLFDEFSAVRRNWS